MQNWYQTYKLSKEAGFKELGLSVLLNAVGLVLFWNYTPEDAAKKLNLSVEQVSDAVNHARSDRSLAEQARETANQQPQQPQQDTEDTYAQFINDLTQMEGLRLNRYNDHLGNPTIGYGHLIRPGENLQRIDRDEATNLLNQDAQQAWTAAQNILSGTNAPPEVHSIIANMSFQMGEAGVNRFTNMISAIQDQDYNRAADEMIRSRWARQTPARARELASRMRSLSNNQELAND